MVLPFEIVMWNSEHSVIDTGTEDTLQTYVYVCCYCECVFGIIEISSLFPTAWI